uniref:Uncharacterized protein n=1 Tax=Physcomitrium patens TaxID=3218 RepID=A0A2K1L8J2_PHYPA|nr:hypothetical protein PHYPA_000783 [Physcomitrium patens]
MRAGVILGRRWASAKSGTIETHRWSSGSEVSCHGTDPGLIPGRCNDRVLCKLE